MMGSTRMREEKREGMSIAVRDLVQVSIFGERGEEEWITDEVTPPKECPTATNGLSFHPSVLQMVDSADGIGLRWVGRVPSDAEEGM